MNQKKKNILICPLEWGLGHAGRMIPVALKLKEMGHNVYIGSGVKHIAFFRKETQGLQYIIFRGFRIRYSARLPQYLVILLYTPLLAYHILREHVLLKRIIRKYQIDIVISDSRPGLWNRRIRTAFVSHIPGIPMPAGLKIIQKVGFLTGSAILRKYNFFLIPDMPGEMNLSGNLSHNVRLPENSRFIGILSRFNGNERENPAKINPGTCTVILSGPEPQRTILKRHIEDFLRTKPYSVKVLGGKPHKPRKKITEGNIEYISHPEREEMADLIRSAELIITRSGYTSIMELVSLNKSAIIIPTPGQPEQEYLALYHSEKGWFRSVRQEDLAGMTDLSVPEPSWPGTMISESGKLLDEALEELLK
jgi:predicted glycosyltransferase